MAGINGINHACSRNQPEAAAAFEPRLDILGPLNHRRGRTLAAGSCLHFLDDLFIGGDDVRMVDLAGQSQQRRQITAPDADHVGTRTHGSDLANFTQRLGVLNDRPDAYPIGLPLSTTEGASTSWYLLTKAFGGDLFDKDWKPLFVSPDSAGYKAMAFEAQLLKDGLVDPASTGLKDSQINDTMFAKGLVSIMISGEPGRLGQYSDPAQSPAVAGNVQAILVPTASGTTRSYGLLEALAIPKVSQNQEAAMAFVKWFTSKEFQIENYGNGVLPTRTSALDELNKAGKLQSGNALVEESKYVEPLFAQGTPTWYPQFSSAVNTAINAVAKGQVTVDQAMQNIADATQKAMTE